MSISCIIHIDLYICISINCHTPIPNWLHYLLLQYTDFLLVALLNDRHILIFNWLQYLLIYTLLLITYFILMYRITGCPFTLLYTIILYFYVLNILTYIVLTCAAYLRVFCKSNYTYLL